MRSISSSSVGSGSSVVVVDISGTAAVSFHTAVRNCMGVFHLSRNGCNAHFFSFPQCSTDVWFMLRSVWVTVWIPTGTQCRRGKHRRSAKWMDKGRGHILMSG